MREFNPTNCSWIVYQEQLEMFFDTNGIKDDSTGKLIVSALLSLNGSGSIKLQETLPLLGFPKKNHMKNYASFSKLISLLPHQDAKRHFQYIISELLKFLKLCKWKTEPNIKHVWQ
ncbi:hypothetical protein JTB14_000953 [Gonioctena quinquepunctata]|nr:hypothetical protein JTB14_000953 [Gonioctena quinquepunctata]